MKKTTFILMGLFILSKANSLPAGKLDQSLGGTGIISLDYDFGGSQTDHPEQVLVQPDGKILVAATADVDNGSNNQAMTLARFLKNGLPDTTFNSSGFITLDHSTGRDQVRDIAVLNDGKILMFGHIERFVTDDFDLYIARYNSDGTVDTTFDNTGYKIIAHDLGGDNSDTAVELIVQSNGLLLLVSQSSSTFGTQLVLTRLNADGSNDTSFGIDPNDNYMAHDVGQPVTINRAVQLSTGSVLVGSTRTTAPDNSLIQLTQFSYSGLLDTANPFAIGGPNVAHLEMEVNNQSLDELTGLAINDIDEVYVVGNFLTEINGPSGPETVMQCFGSRMISSAWSSELLTIDFGERDAFCYDVVVESWSDQAIVVGGSRSPTTTLKMAAARISDMNGDGSLLFTEYDDDFGTQDGRVLLDTSFQNEDMARTVALGDDGKVVLAASQNLDNILISRLTTDKDLIFYSGFD